MYVFTWLGTSIFAISLAPKRLTRFSHYKWVVITDWDTDTGLMITGERKERNPLASWRQIKRNSNAMKVLINNYHNYHIPYVCIVTCINKKWFGLRHVFLLSLNNLWDHSVNYYVIIRIKKSESSYKNWNLEWD